MNKMLIFIIKTNCSIIHSTTLVIYMNIKKFQIVPLKPSLDSLEEGHVFNLMHRSFHCCFFFFLIAAIFQSIHWDLAVSVWVTAGTDVCIVCLVFFYTTARATCARARSHTVFILSDADKRCCPIVCRSVYSYWCTTFLKNKPLMKHPLFRHFIYIIYFCLYSTVAIASSVHKCKCVSIAV